MDMDSVHLIFLFSFNEFTRLGNKVRTELRSFLIRGEEQRVEDTMHLPSRQELKAVGIGGDNLRDLKGFFSLRGQFSGRELIFKLQESSQTFAPTFQGVNFAPICSLTA